MAEKLAMIVMHKDGVWYAKHPGYGQWKPDGYRIDGANVVLCVNPSWCKLDHKPAVVEVLETPPRNVTGYKRRAEFSDLSIGVDMEVPKEFFAYRDADYEHRINEEFWAFYESVLDTPQPFWKTLDVAIVVASLDAEPTKIELPVRFAPPAVFNEWPEVHHLFPCSISSDDLFVYCRRAVVQFIAGKNHLRVDDYESIKTCTVSVNYEYAKPRTEKRDVSGFRARKPKWQTYQKSSEWKNLVSFHGARYSNGAGGVTPSLNGESYADLKAKVEHYAQSIIDQIDDSRVGECPHCMGRGWIQLTTRKDAHGEGD